MHSYDSNNKSHSKKSTHPILAYYYIVSNSLLEFRSRATWLLGGGVSTSVHRKNNRVIPYPSQSPVLPRLALVRHFLYSNKTKPGEPYI